MFGDPPEVIAVSTVVAKFRTKIFKRFFIFFLSQLIAQEIFPVTLLGSIIVPVAAIRSVQIILDGRIGRK